MDKLKEQQLVKKISYIIGLLFLIGAIVLVSLVSYSGVKELGGSEGPGIFGVLILLGVIVTILSVGLVVSLIFFLIGGGASRRSAMQGKEDEKKRSLLVWRLNTGESFSAIIITLISCVLYLFSGGLSNSALLFRIALLWCVFIFYLWYNRR